MKGFVIIMVKHVILWRLRTDHDEAEVRAKVDFCAAAFGRLPSIIPGLVSMKLYTDPMTSSTCDLMLDAVFEDEASYIAYKSNQDHLAVASVIRPLVSERVCMDCEI